MATYDTTTKHALRILQGSNVVSDIDEGFQALADDVDAIMATDDQGAAVDRPTSTPGSPGKTGRYYRRTDDLGLDRDFGTGWGTVVPALVTALPVSPVDGQEVYYLADATNGAIWHLRYRAAAAGSYKWEWLGGSPLAKYIAAEYSGSPTVFTDVPNVSLDIPLIGEYRVKVAGKITNLGGAFPHYYALHGAGLTASSSGTPSPAHWIADNVPLGSFAELAWESPPLALTVATVKLQATRTDSSQTMKIRQVRISAQPVRVG